MHENRFNEYRIPSGMLIVFLEKALTLIHMETHFCELGCERTGLDRAKKQLASSVKPAVAAVVAVACMLNSTLNIIGILVRVMC